MNPTEPKVPVAAAVAGVAGAIVVLIMNLINGEPPNQVALETVITAVVVAALAFGAGWLKKTPLDTLVQRAAADPKAAKVTAVNGFGTTVAVAGTLDAPEPHAREGGHASGQLILISTACAIVVVVVALLLVRAF